MTQDRREIYERKTEAVKKAHHPDTGTLAKVIPGFKSGAINHTDLANNGDKSRPRCTTQICRREFI